MIENEPLTFDGRMASGPSTADLIVRDHEDVLVAAKRRKNTESEWTVRGYVVCGDDVRFNGLDAPQADLAAIFAETYDGADLKMNSQYSTVRPVGDGIPAVVAVDGRPAIAAWCFVRGDGRDQIADLMDVDRRTVTDYLSRFRRRGIGLSDVHALPAIGDHVQEVPDEFLHPAERQPAIPDGGTSTSEESDTVAACPECDRASVQHTSPDEYRCEDCKAVFEEYIERPRRGSHGIRGDSLARKLLDADPDDLRTDGGTEARDRYRCEHTGTGRRVGWELIRFVAPVGAGITIFVGVLFWTTEAAVLLSIIAAVAIIAGIDYWGVRNGR